MSGVVSSIGSWPTATLVRQELRDKGGVPLQLRGTYPYPALSVDVVSEIV